MPFLEAKLTTLVKAAFGGNSRTSVIVNCRGDDAHGDETLQVVGSAQVLRSVCTTLCSLKVPLCVYVCMCCRAVATFW